MAAQAVVAAQAQAVRAGVTSNTGAGGNGGNSGNSNSGVNNSGGGGGGGAGITGGNGGRGGDNFPQDGAGGATPGADGERGENGGTRGAHGGGGGAHGYVGATLPGSIVAGGIGGDGGASTGGGGGGGAGGYGAVVTGSSITGSITTNVTGGAAGSGGNGGNGAQLAGRGGDGGIGLLLTGGTNTLAISSTITGGNGGNVGFSVGAVAAGAGGTGLDLGTGNNATITGSVIGGNGGTPNTGGTTGAGGVAITGSGVNLTIGSTGIVTAGLNGAGVRTNAITFTGGSNTLNLEGGYTITGNVVGTGTDTLGLGGTTSGTFNGSQFTGFAGLNKTGASAWTITGTSALTGAIAVNGGSLIVNGDTTSSSATQVNNLGTLGGTGTVRSVTVNNGGTIAAGNSIGTLNVTGTAVFNSGSHFAVEYDNAHADRLIASGAVTINAGSILDLTGINGAYAVTTGYTILSGSAVTGTFTTVNNNLAFLDASQSIVGGNSLVLTLTRNNVDFSDVAQTQTQAQVGTALAELGGGNDLFDAMVTLTTEQAQAALNTLSGESAAGAAGAVAQSASIVQSVISSHMTGLTHSGGTGNKVALAPAADQSLYVAALLEPSSGAISENMNLWLEAIGGFGQTDARSTTAQQDRHSYGFLGGIDIAFDDAGYYGFFGGYERGEVETDSQGASTDLNNFHLGAFATRPIGNDVSISGGISASYHDISSLRYVVLPGFEAAAKGDTNGYTASGFIEAAKTFNYNEVALEPFANVSLTYAHMDGYDERNGGAANLSIDSVSKTNPATTIGVRAGKSVQAGDSTVNLSGSLGWQHVYGDVENKSQMRFAAGTTSFDSYGPARSRDAAIVGVGVSAKVSTGGNAYAGYNGTLSSDSQDHGFKAGVKWGF